MFYLLYNNTNIMIYCNITNVTERRLSKMTKLQVIGEISPDFAQILTEEALDFVESLVQQFSARREKLLRRREERQEQINNGVMPAFLPETESIRNSDWTIALVPDHLQDRRVEITGPVDRKMMINALNSGANVFMADFEDANSPSWNNMIQGQVNLRDAINRTITYDSPDGKHYQLNEKVATLFVRPRGWHLEEKHVLFDGKPISASLFDFGLYFFHNAKQLIANGSGPYFYLPKLESHLEARLWNDVFIFSQRELGIPLGTIKATVLIETIFAAFEMDEILYELREHSAGLNCGRWDYIFSFIKKFRNKPDFILPDRSVITMTVPFMRSYSLLAIKTSHRRNAHAIGGMAANIPVKDNSQINEDAFAKVRIDKEREARDGHDGTWVAHPGLVPVALEVFNHFMPQPNQIEKKLEDIQITAEDLLQVPEGHITEQGLRTNISVGVQYLESWLRGKGAVPIYHLMEDAATAEISRAQVWQWLHNPNGILHDGRKVNVQLFDQFLEEELEKIKIMVGHDQYEIGKYQLASDLFKHLSLSHEFVEFLTIPGYHYL